MTTVEKYINKGYHNLITILILLGCIFFTLCISSCSLSENPEDQIEEEKIYTSAETVFQHAVASLYSYIGGNTEGQGLAGTVRGVYDLQTFGSDEAIMPTRGVDWFDGGMWQAMYFHSWNSGHEIIKNSWLYLYKMIALCNRSLETIDKHRDLLSRMEYERFTAEVRALRAIYYWYLLDLFGNVPIVTSTSVSMNEVKQSSRLEVYNFVRDELEESKLYLPQVNSAQKGAYYGRVTLPVAIFILAKLYLNAKVYSGTPQWEKCLECCDLLSQMHFDLTPDYADNFIIENETSCENIWTIPMDRVLYDNYQECVVRSLHWRHANACGYIGNNGTSATKTVLVVNHFGQSDQDWRFNHNYWGGVAIDINNRQVTDREGKILIYAPWEVMWDLKGSPYLETAGARMRKYEMDRDSNKDGKLVNNDIVLFRYADVLLMQAEAKERLGQSGQAELDRIRNRARMPLRQSTLENIYDERLIELAWEGWRRNDMIRFDHYRSEASPNDRVDESDGHTKLFPIPGYAMSTNPNLVQNPGY